MAESKKLIDPYKQDWISFLREHRESRLKFEFKDGSMEVFFEGEENPKDTDSEYLYMAAYRVLKDQTLPKRDWDNSLLQITDDDVREMLSIEVLDESEKD